MAVVTQFYTINEVASTLGEDQEMLEAIISNNDNLSYGNIVSVHTGMGEAITAVTDHGIEELQEMFLDARRSTQEWHRFLKDFVADPGIITRVKDKGPHPCPR